LRCLEVACGRRQTRRPLRCHRTRLAGVQAACPVTGCGRVETKRADWRRGEGNGAESAYLALALAGTDHGSLSELNAWVSFHGRAGPEMKNISKNYRRPAHQQDMCKVRNRMRTTHEAPACARATALRRGK